MDLTAFNWVDWVIVGLIVLSTIVGILRGFVREGLSLVVWILAFWLSFTFADGLSQKLLATHISHESVRYGIAFAGIFVVTLIVGGFINFLIGTAVQKTGLGGTDRIVGLAFGFVRGLLVIAVVILFINLTPATKQSWYKEAQLPPHFNWLVSWIHSLIPPSIQQHLQPHLDKNADLLNQTNSPTQQASTTHTTVPAEPITQPANNQTTNEDLAQSSATADIDNLNTSQAVTNNNANNQASNVTPHSVVTN